MPKYFYKCLEEKCEQDFEVVHSMSDRLDTCLYCSGSATRVPANTVNVFKNATEQTKQKTGSIVKKSIEAFRKDLKDEKKRLSEVEYK